MEKNTAPVEERQMSEYISPTETAKVARRELKKTFKGTKFSVRTSKYAGGSSVRVNWTDGPTVEQVNEIVGFMHGMSFDGMTDSSSYHDSVLFGEAVHFGNSFIFTNREVSEGMFREAVAKVAADYGPDVDKFTIEVTTWEHGGNTAYFGGFETHGVLNTMEVQRLVREVVSQTSV